MWVTSYEMTKQSAIADGSLKYRDIGNDFRKETNRHPPPKASIGKGAFATYAGEPEEAQDEESRDAYPVEDQKPTRKGAAMPRRGKGKRTSQTAARGNGYPAFPEKAPHSFEQEKRQNRRLT
jgi:hypothetical protein